MFPYQTEDVLYLNLNASKELRQRRLKYQSRTLELMLVLPNRTVQRIPSPPSSTVYESVKSDEFSD
jgi:hypothetical protein